MTDQTKKTKNSRRDSIPDITNTVQIGARTTPFALRDTGTCSRVLPSNPEDKTLIARLLGEYHDDDDVMWELGNDEGYHWALESASAIELRRLAHDRSLRLDWLYKVHRSPYSDAERFFFIIRPDQDGDCAAASEFWEYEARVPRALSRIAFLQGFFDGALEVWKRVKDRV